MRVVTMAIIEAFFYCLVGLTILIALCSYWLSMLVYFNAVLLFLMLYLQIVSIPLHLNWSRNMYAGLLRRQFFLVGFTALIYATHFYFGGIMETDRRQASFLDALYFSFTTWTTLGYGDLTVAHQLRLATSLEALTGVLTVAVLTALVWLYCQERLQPRSADVKAHGEFQLQLDQSLGLWRELESQQVLESAKIRARATTLQPCPKCGQAPKMDKFFDMVGRLAPFAYFIVVCDCGAHSRPKRNVYLAEREWNKNGPIATRKPSNLRGRLMLYVVLPTARVASAVASAFAYALPRRRKK